MGGRGALSGNSFSGAKVTFEGATTEYYFTKRNGINYVQRDINGTPNPTPDNMSAKEYLQRAQNNGAEVHKISSKEIAAKKKAHKKHRQEMDRFLNHQSASDRMMAKGSRAARRSRNAR